MSLSFLPCPGRVSFFSSGSENLHRVEKVTWGTRYAITVSFTCDPAHAISDPALPWGSHGWRGCPLAHDKPCSKGVGGRGERQERKKWDFIWRFYSQQWFTAAARPISVILFYFQILIRCPFLIVLQKKGTYVQLLFYRGAFLFVTDSIFIQFSIPHSTIFPPWSFAGWLEQKLLLNWKGFKEAKAGLCVFCMSRCVFHFKGTCQFLEEEI